MSARMTFVGIAKCGHAQYLAQDPATYAKPPDNARDIAEEYKSLVDDLRHYAVTGQIRLVSDTELAKIIDAMKTCRCNEATK